MGHPPRRWEWHLLRHHLGLRYRLQGPRLDLGKSHFACVRRRCDGGDYEALLVVRSTRSFIQRAFQEFMSIFSQAQPAPAIPTDTKEGLLEEIHRNEARTENVDPLLSARLWNRLGTLAHAERDEEALKYLGNAIDAYLECGYFDAAAALCRRVIRLHPEVVRARCTLAFLSIGRRNLGDAVQEITEYTMAAKRTGTQLYAIPRLRLMAQATYDPSVLRCITSALGELGDGEGQEYVREHIQEGQSAVADDAGDRWERLLAVALLNREQLRRRNTAVPERTEESVWEASCAWSAA